MSFPADRVRIQRLNERLADVQRDSALLATALLDDEVPDNVFAAVRATEGGFRGLGQEARDSLHRALSELVAAHDEPNDNRMRLTNEVFRLFVEMGHLDEAERLAERVLQSREHDLEASTAGSEHAQTLTAVANLAYITLRRACEPESGNVHDAAKADEARRLFERALAGHERQLGLEHVQTLGSYQGLGVALERLGQQDEARRLLERARRGHELLAQRGGKPPIPSALRELSLLPRGPREERPPLVLCMLSAANPITLGIVDMFVRAKEAVEAHGRRVARAPSSSAAGATAGR